MMDLYNVLIVGCGGVGSNLAYMLSKRTNVGDIYLVDYDKVDKSNLDRQLFTEQDIGHNKAEALANNLKQLSPKHEYYHFDMKIEAKEQFAVFPENALVFACTDNVKSKKLIAGYFLRVLCLGCDENIVEASTKFREDTTWSIADGYNGQQSFESNLIAAYIGYIWIEYLSLSIKCKVDISRLRHNIIANVLAGGSSEEH